MMEFLSIVLLVFGVLQIILFFKLWGMTNNVSQMKNIMEDYLSQIDQGKERNNTDVIQKGSIVVRLKDEKQLRVLQVNGYTFVCRPLEGGDSASYGKNEIELFDVYYKK